MHSVQQLRPPPTRAEAPWQHAARPTMRTRAPLTLAQQRCTTHPHHTQTRLMLDINCLAPTTELLLLALTALIPTTGWYSRRKPGLVFDGRPLGRWLWSPITSSQVLSGGGLWDRRSIHTFVWPSGCLPLMCSLPCTSPKEKDVDHVLISRDVCG